MQIVQALAAGNAVVVKPPPGRSTPLHLFHALAVEAGVDPDLFVLSECDPAVVDEVLEAGVDKVFLTGSADTGRAVMKKVSWRMIPSVMELSGCDAAFVLPDADMEMAGRSIWYGMTLNSGTTCIAPRRVFVPRDLKDELVARLTALAANAKPVEVDGKTLGRLRVLVRDALEEAESRGGGMSACLEDFLRSESLPEGVMYPLILTEAWPEMAMLQQDVAAPVLCIIGVEDMEEALRLNELCPFALGASVFGSEGAARLLAARVNAGVVVVNDMIVPTADPRLPFGARGGSGFGVTRGAEGLLEMTRPKAITVRRGKFRPHLDEARPGDERLFGRYLAAAHGPSAWRRLRAKMRLLALLMKRGKTRHAIHDIQRAELRMKTSDHRVGVIGGGLGGLAAACTLAVRGHQVTVFESNSWLGGKAAALNDGGFRFDMGPTILTLPGVLRRIFEESGRKLEDYLSLFPLDPQWRCFFDGGGVLDLSADVALMQETLGAILHCISGRGGIWGFH